MRRRDTLATLIALTLALSSLACGQGERMMGHMSGRQMMDMMHDPAVMDDWMDAMTEDPELMATMMMEMHRRMREDGRAGMPLYCPMMGYTPENPPTEEPEYEPGSLADRQLFERKCSRCHALPDPDRHTGSEWGETLERMETYIGSAAFVSASAEEMESIRDYLQAR